MVPFPKVVVSVVSGSNPQRIVDLVDSLQPSVARQVELTIVATVNSGDPDLARTLATRARTKVVVNATPRGFATNHNSVMAGNPADFFILANDDVVATPDAVLALISYLQSAEHSQAAVASPQLLNRDGSIQPSTYSFPTLTRALLAITGLRRLILRGRIVHRAARFMGYGGGRSRLWAHDHTVTVQTLRGAFVAVRAAAVNAVGLMDEVSLVGGEETEWHKRLSDAGWTIDYVHSIQVVHYGSETVGGKPDLKVEYLKGLLNYFTRHETRWKLNILRLVSWISYLFRWFISILLWRTQRARAARRAMRVARLWKYRDAISRRPDSPWLLPEEQIRDPIHV